MVVASCDRCKQDITDGSTNALQGTVSTQFVSYELCSTCMASAQTWVEAGA